MECRNCDKQFPDTKRKTCPDCRKPLSVPADTLESLMRDAGVPDLALLFQQAKDDGLIKPVLQYGGPTEGKP